MYKVEIEKIPSLQCSTCESTYVIMTDEGPYCDDCNRVTVQSSNTYYEGTSLPIDVSKILNKTLY